MCLYDLYEAIVKVVRAEKPATSLHTKPSKGVFFLLIESNCGMKGFDAEGASQ